MDLEFKTIKIYFSIVICVFFLISCKTKEGATEKIVSKENSEIKDDSISSDNLRIDKEISLGSVKGRIDHLAIDDSSKTLYVAALGNNSIEVVDLKLGSVINSIKDIEEPQSIIYLKEKNLFCVSSGGSGECKFYDIKTYSLVKNMKIGSDADNMRYYNKRIYVGYGEGAIGIIDVENLSFTNSIKLLGHPESFQIDKSRNKIYVNIPASKSIEVIDLENNSITDSWILKDAASNFPMAFDENDNLLFIGCRNPTLIIVYDITTGKEINRFDIKEDVDDIFYDSENNYLFVSCGEGYLQLFKQEDKSTYKLIQEVNTPKGSRTSLFIPESKKIYLAVPGNKDLKAKLQIYNVSH